MTTPVQNTPAVAQYVPDACSQSIRQRLKDEVNHGLSLYAKPDRKKLWSAAEEQGLKCDPARRDDDRKLSQDFEWAVKVLQADEKTHAAAAAQQSSGSSSQSTAPYFPVHDDHFVELLHKDHPGLRFIWARHAWYQWNIDTRRWAQSPTIILYSMIKNLLRREINDYWKDAKSADDKDRADKARKALRDTLLNDPKKASIERYAQSHEGFVSQLDQWDANDWQLSTQGGVVDFSTQEAWEARPEDHCLLSTMVAPAKGEPKEWMKFLARVTNNDQQLQDYLQRVAGYWLTGSTREHALFYFYGPGGNGKSTFLETVQAIMGDYAAPLPLGTLMEAKSERHPTELADIYAARLVVTTEVAEGTVWDTAKVKYLTGGDKIKARFMHHDFFSYVPKFKIAIAGNNQPILRHVDEGFRRRFHLIPFTVKIDSPDKKFMEKLRPEWAQILNWMIEGTRLWMEQGLNPPDAVTKATADYLESQDRIGQFLAARCTVDLTNPRYEEPIAALWKAWDEWCKQESESPGKKADLISDLVKRGLVRAKGTGGVRVLKGIRLK
jgi:P4 family phage/plasmid primase-like protien